MTPGLAVSNFYDVQRDLSDHLAAEAEPAGRSRRNVEKPSRLRRPAIADPEDEALVVLDVSHSNLGAVRQRLVGCPFQEQVGADRRLVAKNIPPLRITGALQQRACGLDAGLD